MRLASRFGHVNQIRRDRPLTHEELMHYVPSIFGEDRHTSRSERYAYIPTITVLESLQREGFQPFFACQTRVRDPGRRGYTKHMLRLRRDGEINGQHVPEIILLNSHDGITVTRNSPTGQTMTTDAEAAVSEALRDLAFWLYRQLENEYDWLTSDAAVDEALLINEYTFTEAGLHAG